jgi:DNA-binding transcriptional regulator YiaG
MWNVCVKLLRQQLAVRGSKAQLARYLGVPRQRLNDFLQGKSRLPDAELTLRMLHWLEQARSGRRPSA